VKKCVLGLVFGSLQALGCAGAPRTPSGPPPEYEKPQVSEWDAGAPPPASPAPFVDELEKAPQASDAGTGGDAGFADAR